MAFLWNEEKNEALRSERGLSFERIVVAIEEGHLIDILEHPNKEKYGNQIIMIVDVEGYAICVPIIEKENGDFFMKTLYPSRKYTRIYDLEGRYE
ncbi:MAG: toxin [Candidatus Competibacteraceae bacterium]|nr:toxin [Candidatus Competibacteraceae bacterium]